MKIHIKVIKQFDVKYLFVEARVRYWEDTEVNGVEDTEGDLIPFRVGDLWSPLIDIEEGKIINWPIGTTAKVNYKVCDAGQYTLKDCAGVDIIQVDGYVPTLLAPNGGGFGDYIILDIDKKGFIDGWYCDEGDITEQFTAEDSI